MSEDIASVRQRLDLPVSPGEHVVVHLTRPMTEAEWTNMLAILATMKSALVEQPLFAPASPREEPE